MQRWFNPGKPISRVYHICRLKEKNHKTVLIDADRIQLCLHLSFMIKNKQLSKLEIEGNFPSIILSYEILSAFPKISSNAEVSAPTTSVQHPGDSRQHNRQEKGRWERSHLYPQLHIWPCRKA